MALDDVAPLAALTEGRVAGTVDGALELQLDGPEPSQWHGNLRISALGLDLRNANLGGLTLERLPLGHADLELELPAGTGEVRVQSCEVTGTELELSASGRVILAPELARSRVELSGRLRVTGQTKENLGDMLSLLGYKADEQGWLDVSVGGTLWSPRASPSRSGTLAEP